MKRSIVLATLATIATTGAFAQSSVTVYGRLNTSVEHQKSGDESIWALQNNASRIGFKGTEDLGGGLTAGFQIEHGFNVDSGTQSQTAFWARQSEVNLGSKSLGTVRLGNFTSEAYYATADYVSMHNHDTGTSSDALYAYVTRNTNKVAYRTPTFAGFNAEVALSLNESQAANERSIDLAANYSAGPLHVGAGYGKFGKSNQFAISALYELGAFTVGGYVQRDDNGLNTPPTAVDIGTRTTWRLSGMYTVGAGEVHLNVGRAGEYSKLADTDATQWTVAYNHNLSKRTKVYTFYTKVRDDSGLYGGDFSSLAFGVRHNF
ncbi:porin [Piscinibacter sp. XHJ-5]|uniref:porin n=1 Tax=Piscinibacter sp. XHJ-5 TaxID=3037797 RepID=UPI002452DB00|nr:porin [Piscinibacter sp. XHJ-5]